MGQENLRPLYSPEKEKPRRLRIILDLDEVLFDSIADWPERLNQLLETSVSLDRVFEFGHTTLVPEWINYGEQFYQASEQIRADSEFIRHHPLVSGAKQGIEYLLNLGCEIKAYLTSRPESVSEATREALVENEFPEAEIICRPNDCQYENATKWKAVILNDLAEKTLQEGEILIVIDDNPYLSEAVAQLNPDVIVITLEGEHNQNQIPDNNLFHAPWQDLPDLIEKLLLEKERLKGKEII